MPFCTSCGNEISPNHKFCTTCGAPVESVHLPSALQVPPPHSRQPITPGPALVPGPGQPVPGATGEPLPAPPSPPMPPPSGAPAVPSVQGRKTGLTLLAAVAAIVIIAAILFIVLQRPGILTTGGAGSLVTPPVTTVETTVEQTPQGTVLTTVPTPAPVPFPGALSLRTWFEFNEGKYKSRATVYRYWINETYQWHNDKDNRYYTQRPKTGNKYLFVYVVIVNEGTTAYPYPKSGNIRVHSGGSTYLVDPTHYIPDKAGDRDATAVGIQEIQQQSDYFNSEFVEDYSLSHGTTSDFIYPGQSNAIDGYLIYEVPASLSPDKTWVEIQFDGDDTAVWKLA